MTEPEPLPPDGIDPERIRQAFTARELGQWETHLGLALAEFPGSYLSAMLAWWAARQDGEPRSQDDFLDMSIADLEPYMNRAVDLLGKPPTGEPRHSGTSEETTSETSPNSDTSITSQSQSFETSPA
jgi:hypothetical protein